MKTFAEEIMGQLDTQLPNHGWTLYQVEQYLFCYKTAIEKRHNIHTAQEFAKYIIETSSPVGSAY